MSVESIKTVLERAGDRVPERTSERSRAPVARHPSTRLPFDVVRARENRVVMPDDPGAAAQAYRMLRTQVLQRVRRDDVRALGIVSAADGEGKTLTAINLALGIAAETNQDVLLVDLDLRRPSVASVLGLTPPQGLEGWFASVTPIGDVCYGLEGVDRLEIIPTLAPVGGSSGMLASRRAQEMLLELKSAQSHGLVIIDLPPVLLTDDFLTVAPVLDGVVLVASEGVTKREDIVRTLELIGNTRLVGTVLNRASESEKRAY